MKDSNNSKRGVPRRDVLKGAAAAGLGLAAGASPSSASPQASPDRDLTRREHAKPGTPHSLLTHPPTPPGKTQASARLERYDRLVYQTEALPLPESTTSRLLTATLSRETFSATLDSLTLFDAVPIHSIPNQHRIGIATWGPDPMIERVTLSRPRH